jgi:hypothetical protein
MMIKKCLPRLFWAAVLLLLTAVCAMTVISAKETDSPRTLNVRDYGAVGDGVTNDTAAINAAAADLRDGDTLYIPAGTYLVREHGKFSVILVNEVKDAQIVLDEKAVIQLDTVPDNALPQQNRHFVFHLRYCENVTFSGGIIYGDRLRYDSTAHCEQGYGIRISDCRNVTVRDVEIAHMRGDGIWVFSDTYVDAENGVKGQSYDITVDNCHVHDCFRNGITLTSVVGCVISNTVVHGIKGTAPQAAVDIEAEYPGSFNQDVTIENCDFYDNGILSVAVTQKAQNISIVSSNLEQHFVFSDEGDGLLLSDCTASLVCISGKNAVIEDSNIYQLRLYGDNVTCRNTVFDGKPSSSRGWKEDAIPFRILVTKSEGTVVGHFENCTFRGRGLCALGGCIVFLHSPPAEMTFTDCTFKSCGLIPFLGHLDTTEREGCFFDIGWALWLCILTVAALITLLVLRRRKKKIWVSKPAT